MAKTSVRITRNREALDRAKVALGDGILAVCQEIVDTAEPPDATPYGEGLVDKGAAAVWVDGRKIGGEAVRPRAVRVREHEITGIAGFGFPGRFQEIGTAHHGAQPFLRPAVDRVTPRGPAIVAGVVSAVTGRP